MCEIGNYVPTRIESSSFYFKVEENFNKRKQYEYGKF